MAAAVLMGLRIGHCGAERTNFGKGGSVYLPSSIPLSSPGRCVGGHSKVSFTPVTGFQLFSEWRAWSCPGRLTTWMALISGPRSQPWSPLQGYGPRSCTIWSATPTMGGCSKLRSRRASSKCSSARTTGSTWIRCLGRVQTPRLAHAHSRSMCPNTSPWCTTPYKILVNVIILSRKCTIATWITCGSKLTRCPTERPSRPLWTTIGIKPATEFGAIMATNWCLGGATLVSAIMARGSIGQRRGGRTRGKGPNQRSMMGRMQTRTRRGRGRPEWAG
mmetsp:Transcript_1658/g.2735  ORF Transcript_1658/g.2735 Transcript_1658/m.2735 type:complete len:275 (-) Transcript_1658:102-926(-)